MSQAEPNNADLEAAHRLHPYCARFPSEIATAAIRQFTKQGESVYDPFCGSGTSLTAGLLLGRRVIGSDIDALAGMLSGIKCAPASEDAYLRWRMRFASRVERSFAAVVKHWSDVSSTRPGAVLSIAEHELELPSFQQLNYWFPPQVIALLAAIAEDAQRSTDEHMRHVALISLSAAILGKWPHTLSYAMDVDHTRPHRVVQRFSPRRVLAAYYARLDRTVSGLLLLRRMYEDAGVASRLAKRSRIIYPHDARLATPDVADESQTLVVTSPPYFNAVDYPRAHRLSLCWMNGRAPGDITSRKQYIGLRHGLRGSEEWLEERGALRQLIPRALRVNGRFAKLAGFFEDLDKTIRQVWRVLRPGGHAVIVIADNCIKGHTVRSGAAVVQIAQAAGFQLVTRHSRAIDSVRRRFPVGPFGFDGPMTREHIVVVRRPTHRGSRTPR